jgi:hypothetical protein
MLKFRIYVTFNTGDRHLDTDWCESQKLLEAMERLRCGPAAQAGLLKEVRVVDNEDCIVFLVQNGRVVYPTVIDVSQLQAKYK